VTAFRAFWIAIAGLVLLAAPHAVADEQFPHGLLSSVEREGSCTIETRPVDFGTYDPMALTDKYAVGNVIYTCHRDRFGRLLRVRIAISAGNSGNYEGRRMHVGANFLYYNLYLDGNDRNVWGDGSRGTDTYFKLLPPSDTRISVPVYGRIASRQDVAGGDYSDLLQVTITF
jgi:spore coat protein U-like protein